MKLHNLKIEEKYAVAKLAEVKLFEIRLDDRNYQLGDLINYTVEGNEPLNRRIKENIYQITYITDYKQKPGYIVFAEKKIN